MKDLIDLGNLVFDQLIAEHGELAESRTLFLYGITTGSSWQVLNSQKTLVIDKGGVSKNFEDKAIDAYDRAWKNLIKEAELTHARQVLNAIKREDNPKDGDTIEFGKSSGEWRNIDFNL